MGKTNFSTYLAIKHQLLELLRQNQFEQNRLPSESVLAQMMGVSLVTLRESLMMLALEGYITKHHGSGNYMHRSTLDYENRSIFYAECLAAEGHQVEVKTISRRILTPEPELQEKLGLSPEQNVFRAEVIFYSDGLPAIWVLAAVTIGGSLMGILGMLIGVPIAATCYHLLREEINRK